MLYLLPLPVLFETIVVYHKTIYKITILIEEINLPDDRENNNFGKHRPDCILRNQQLQHTIDKNFISETTFYRTRNGYQGNRR